MICQENRENEVFVVNWKERSMVGLVDRVVGRLEVPLRAFLLKSERRWRSLATCHHGGCIIYYIEKLYTINY